MSKELCPCHSGQCYQECCQPYHQGMLPENAQVLMRSRYSAYAMGLVDYIIQTTHSDHPDKALKKLSDWEHEIKEFSSHTKFEGLELLDFQENDNLAQVTFRATLSAHGTDISFSEVSTFEKVDGHWLYKSGECRK